MIILLSLTYNSFAQNVDAAKNNQTVLKESEVFIAHTPLSLQQVKKKPNFIPCTTEHLNLGFARNTIVWVRLHLYNSSKNKMIKILEIRNPLLEKVTFYEGYTTHVTGMMHKPLNDSFINNTYTLNFKAYEKKTLYIKIENTTTAMRFGIFLKDEATFIKDELHQQYLIVLFFGILLTLLIYNISLYTHIKNQAFLYYCFYLIALTMHQSTYLGMTPIIFPRWISEIDNISVLYKVNTMYIAASLFAKSFLQTEKYPRINRMYNAILLLALVEMPLFGTQHFYYPEVGILTGFMFVVFNFSAGVYIYLQGYKQARFFVVAWSVLVLGFIVIIFDALGVINTMATYPNIVMYSTAFEAMVLSLVFTDSYTILQEEKLKVDTLLMKTMTNYQNDLKQEIENKTISLNNEVQNKEVLLKELHHRTKNNLQFILSMLHLQMQNSTKAVKEKLHELDWRIHSIAKSYQMLYLKDDLNLIDMGEYLEELCNDIYNEVSSKNIEIDINVTNTTLPLRESGYIGIIANEIITNAIKHTDVKELVIFIEMHQKNGEYFLDIYDNGNGCKQDKIKSGMGIQIIQTLVENQLEGTITLESNNQLKYIIRFTL